MPFGAWKCQSGRKGNLELNGVCQQQKEVFTCVHVKYEIERFSFSGVGPIISQWLASSNTIMQKCSKCADALALFEYLEAMCECRPHMFVALLANSGQQQIMAKESTWNLSGTCFEEASAQERLWPSHFHSILSKGLSNLQQIYVAAKLSAAVIILGLWNFLPHPKLKPCHCDNLAPGVDICIQDYGDEGPIVEITCSTPEKFSPLTTKVMMPGRAASAQAILQAQTSPCIHTKVQVVCHI